MNVDNIQDIAISYIFGLTLISMLIYWAGIAFQQFKGLLRLGNFMTIVVNIGIACVLSVRWIYSGYFPLSNLYESLLFLSWGLTFIHLILEKNVKNNLIGGVISPINMFIIGFSSLSLPKDMQRATSLVPALKSNWLMMHVSVMMISYATLIIGSLLSVLFLVVTRGREVDLEKKSIIFSTEETQQYFKDSEALLLIGFEDKNSTRQQQYISFVESIDNLSYRTIGFGFPLLTLGIVAGAVWANEAWGSYWSWDPKETWALITWLIFASYLHTRINKAWQGRKPALLASLGFIVVWVCYLGVNFLGKGLHTYGWLS